MGKFEKIIEEKKIKSANRVPKYGMRKLSVGLVSCTLGFSILGITDPVQAQEAGIADTAQVQEIDDKDPDQAVEAANESIESLEKTEEEKQVETITKNENTEEVNKSDLQKDSHPESIENESEKEVLQVSEEKVEEAQKASAESNEQNYSKDEEKIKDYSGSERYKETDLQPGDTNQEFYKGDEKVEKDGFKFDFKNPSAESPSKTEYGYQITIDKKTGQRTYTKVYVTDSGLVPVNPGDKPMMNVGEKATPGSPDVTYKPTENSTIDAAKRQRNLNYKASEETLKHINNKDNDSTSLGMKDNYTQENPGVKFFGGNFALGYKVNPWPNENDKLEELKLNKNNYDEKAKYFVQGQDIDTGIKVDNVDENAKERLVGQVYNPVTGKIVPGASAYIGDNGNIHIKMPEGALKKDENGKTVINEDSIFNSKEYRGLQNLDVKFFARPRTAEEFRKIAETPDDFGDTGTYVETGAGTADINHKGNNVTIDKQGIDRYDHYNKIGDFKLNLDDTRYYDQSFKDENGDDTSKHTSSSVKPGDPFEVKIYEPEDPRETDKSSSEMNAAENRGEAAGRVILDFINKANVGKEDKDQWKVTLTEGDIGKFTITPPKSAKAGDFVAIPVEYTYTNGSKDVHWFHFVVQESDNYRPEYHAKAGYKGDSLTTKPEPLPSKDETKKNLPTSYELVPGTYKDSAGNVWENITVDKDTGEVTAIVPEDADIKGGETLFVDVKVNYIDEDGTESEETVKAQFIARPKYKQEVTKEFTSEIPFETKVVYDENLEAGKIEKTEGVVGEMKTSFKQVVINGEKGIINDAGEFVKGEEIVEVKTTKEKQDAIIRIGTKPAETKVEIPFDTEYELDYTRKDGDPVEITPGQKGEITVKTSRDPETGEIKVTQEETKAPTKRKLSIPAGTEGVHKHEEKIPFKYDITYDENLKAGEYVIDVAGKEGTKTTTWNIKNSKIDGEPIVDIEKPVDAKIRVGQKDFTGTVKNTVTKEVPYTVKVVENPNLEAGQTNVKQEGKAGSRTYEYSGEIVNGQLKDGTNFTEKEIL